MTAAKPTIHETGNPVRIDRKLPPRELNARRRRKRNVTRLPALAPIVASARGEGAASGVGRDDETVQHSAGDRG